MTAHGALAAPDDLERRLALAEILQRAGDYARAITQYEIAAALCAADARARIGLAEVYAAVGLIEEALLSANQALDIDPGSARARSALELARGLRGPAPSAQIRAAARPLFDEAGRLEAAGQPAQAMQLLVHASQRFPGVAPIHYRLGCLLQDAGQAEAALSHHELAARLQPGLFGAVHNAGKLAAGFGLAARARPYLRQAERLRPQDGIAMRLELLTDAIHESTDAIASARARFEEGLDRLLESPRRIEDPLNKADVATFYLAYHGLCNRDLQIKIARVFARAIPDLAWEAPHCAKTGRRPGRIRIGFISQFMRNHSIGKVARGLIAELDRARFEVYVLNIPPAVPDDTARWIQARSDHWLILGDSLPAARAEIGALELDILFYQDIGMEPFSYLLAFARLAKVQCVSFGHPDTTGIPAMDYYVSNDWYERPGAAADYSERLYELHALPTLAYYHRPAVPASLPTRSELGLPADERLYLCPQTLFKLHPDFDGVIRRILERDDDARVVLFSGHCEYWGIQLKRRFRRAMPALADRIQFLPRQPHARFLGMLNAADVILDTPQFNGMITSLDAFSVGAAVVTLPTALQRGRTTQAMYRAMDIDGAVASDADEYARLAVDIAMNPDRRQALRTLIAERSHRLFEERRAVTEFERFFLAAHAAAGGET